MPIVSAAGRYDDMEGLCRECYPIAAALLRSPPSRALSLLHMGTLLQSGGCDKPRLRSALSFFANLVYRQPAAKAALHRSIHVYPEGVSLCCASMPYVVVISIWTEP